MTLASRSARGAVFLSATNLLSIVVGFGGGVILARLLGPNDFGTFALAVTIASLGDLRSKLQLEQKYMSDEDLSAEHFNTFFTLNVGLALISFAGLLLASGVILWLRRSDLALSLAVVAAFGLLDPLASAIRVSLERQIAFGRVGMITSAANIIQFVVTLAAALAGLGLWSLVIGYGVNAALNLILFVRVAPQRPRLRANRQLAREFLRYGLKYGLVFATSITILSQFDNFMIGLLRGTADLGFYDRAYRTALWPTLLFSASLGRVSLPTYTRVKDSPAQLAKAFSLVLWGVLSFTAPMAIVFLLTAPDLVSTLYGPRWLPSVPILQALAAFAVFRAMLDDARSILVATGRSGQLARLMLVQAVVMVTLLAPLTYWQGGVGAAIAVGLAFLISTGYVFYFGRQTLHINLLESAGLPLLNNLITLGLYLALRAVAPWNGLPAWERLSLEVATILGLYVLISLLTGRRLIASRLAYVARSLRG